MSTGWRRLASDRLRCRSVATSRGGSGWLWGRPLRAAGDGTVVEELELEAEGDPKHIAEFLQACGLDADETNRALEEIGVRAGSTLLRVKRGGERSTFEVTEPAADERPARPTLPSVSPPPVLAS